jgi:hypothetical protein
MAAPHIGGFAFQITYLLTYLGRYGFKDMSGVAERGKRRRVEGDRQFWQLVIECLCREA